MTIEDKDPPNRRKRFLKAISVVGAIFLSAFGFLVWSFTYSRGEAIDLIQRVPESHTLTYEGFQLQRMNGAWEPHWSYSFESEAYVTGPLQLEFNLLGAAIGSNPSSALSAVLALPKKEEQANKTSHGNRH